MDWERSTFAVASLLVYFALHAFRQPTRLQFWFERTRM